MWNKEQDFSRYIIGKLKRAGCNPIRVESGTTGVGFPDLYVMGLGDYFIELKNVKYSIDDYKWKIPWRAGQQAWAQTYRQYHTSKSGAKCTWTFVGMTDGVVFIRMSKFAENNTVYAGNNPDVFRYSFYKLRNLNLGEFLQAHSQVDSQEVA